MSVAIIGGVVGIAGTVYGVVSSQAAISAANSAKPKKFVPIDPYAVNKLAGATDTAGYAMSDADWAKRFPALVAGREASIQDAASQLEGGQSQQVTDALKKSGLNVDISGNEFQQAQKLGLPILSKEQRDRTYFQKLLGDNPQRQFGLSGQDVAHIAIANTNSQNNYNQGLFGSRINAYNSQIAQNAQNTGAIVSGFTGLANIGANAYQNYSLSPQINQPVPVNDPLNSLFYTKPALPYSSIGTGADDPTMFHTPPTG